MVYVKVEAHADRIRRHQIVDLTVLVHIDLRVARARAQRPHNHRRTTFLTPDQLCYRIYIFNRKTDNRTAWLHPAYLFRTNIRQSGHSFALNELRVRDQLPNGAAHRVRAKKKRLVQTARAQQPVGKDVATLGVGAELDFIDRQKIAAHPLWHRLDGADPILRARRDDPLLSGDESDHGRATCGNDPVVDLARQQT